MKAFAIFAVTALMGAGTAFAAPPDFAPAWGYHKNFRHGDGPAARYPEGGYYDGRSGAVYRRDYGIAAGRCDRDAVGAVLGGVTGAVIGGQMAGREDRVVGMVVGGVVGSVLGHAIGDSLDSRDRACIGQALELGRPGVPVAWRHDGHAYRFTPRGDARDGCRYATLVVDGRGARDVVACPAGRGEWRFRGS